MPSILVPANTPTQLLPSEPYRHWAQVTNPDAYPVYLALGVAAVSRAGVPVYPGGDSWGTPYTGTISAICQTAIVLHVEHFIGNTLGTVNYTGPLTASGAPSGTFNATVTWNWGTVFAGGPYSRVTVTNDDDNTIYVGLGTTATGTLLYPQGGRAIIPNYRGSIIAVHTLSPGSGYVAGNPRFYKNLCIQAEA